MEEVIPEDLNKNQTAKRNIRPPKVWKILKMFFSYFAEGIGPKVVF